ncbi:hypothetical protein JWYL7_0002 [Alkalithermobacter thermoalcaliphilus JW-YL-7 = DSM 7308]|uniref:Uncharacterized protein n=2 Tax=Clostridium paradoxum TaxID=29346 RepID=A0A150FMQ8_CLOPD|nr:hypothetical protein JWYL7_0002 [[Clostridium] paradoxum JW-YL-7 = DSM 7308]
MPVYKYMVVNEAGEKIKSVIHANNENEVLSILRKYNYYPIEIKEIKKNPK